MRNVFHPRSISISHAGDPIYHVAQLEDGQFAYGESSRNEKIFFTFFSPDLDLVTRWFIYQAGEAFRVRADCASMYFPCYTYEQRPGYELDEVEKYTYTLKTPAGQVLPMRMDDDLINDYSDTVRFSYICDIPVRDLLDSFLDPDGHPALEAFVVEE
ncbi:MAG: Imm61 family immunity protein [Actinomyces sp.]|nr:Imm61 family immunity protein [Actinomyces sp.]